MVLSRWPPPSTATWPPFLITVIVSRECYTSDSFLDDGIFANGKSTIRPLARRRDI